MNKHNTKSLAIVAALSLVIQKAYATPNNLPWPIAGKGVQDTTFFYDADDSVTIPKQYTKGRLECNNGGFATHLGVDIKANPGEIVKAIEKGKVLKPGSAPGWGQAIVLSHGNWSSVYWHIAPTVREGQEVQRGTPIGRVISTTHMNDVNHLHLGIANDGKRNIDGFYGCNVRATNTKYLNPYNFLSNARYIILDDADISTTYNLSWSTINTQDFYHGKGFRKIDITKNPDAAVRLKTGEFQNNYTFDVYTRLPPSNDYSSNAKYTLNIYNKKVTNPSYTFPSKVLDQRTFRKGENKLLFQNVNIKRGQRLDIVVQDNKGGQGRFLAVDAFILVAK